MVSLNPIMVDGTGMCGGCRVKVGDQVKFACVDGPDFDGHQVDFDDLMTRLRRYTTERRPRALVDSAAWPSPTGAERRGRADGRAADPSDRDAGRLTWRSQGPTRASGKVRASSEDDRNGQEENHPHHSADSARRCASRTPRRGRSNFDEVACGYSARRGACARPSAACSARTSRASRGCPVGIDIPGFIQQDRRERSPRRLRHHHRHQPAAVGLRPRLPAGEPVRGRVHRRRHARAGGDRPARALRRRHRDHAKAGPTFPYIEPTRLPRRHRRLGAGRPGVRRRPGQGRLRRHGLRGVPRAGRRAALRHPRFPPAERR